MNHDDRHQTGASARSVLVSSLVLRRPVRRHQATVATLCNNTNTRRTARWRSSWSPRRCHQQSLWQAKTTFVRIACTSYPFELGHCGIPSRLIFGNRTRASINRTSHLHNMGWIIETTLALISSPSPRTPLLLRLFFPCTCSSPAYKAIRPTTLE